MSAGTIEIHDIEESVHNELLRALEKFPPFHSAHEGYAVICEELDELKAHVWTNQKRRDWAAMQKEAIQVAAMAMRFAIEIHAGNAN